MTNQYEQSEAYHKGLKELSEKVATKFNVAPVKLVQEDETNKALWLYQDWNRLIPLVLEHDIDYLIDECDNQMYYAAFEHNKTDWDLEYWKDHETKELALTTALMKALLEVG